MKEKDSTTIKLMRNNEVFADAFNYLIYGGKQVINPNKLMELDTREMAILHDDKKKTIKSIQRIRDVMKYAVVKKNEKTKYLLLGIENQSNIHYSMPIRNILYDALRYTKQVEDIIASHQSAGDYKNVNSDEFLSGFRKDDRILPVITLVIYFGNQEWDGPLSIHEMLTEQDEEELALIPDYKVNLIAPYSIDDKDFDKFQSSLKEVLSFIKYAKNEDKLQDLLDSNKNFHHVGEDAVNVLNECVNAKIKIKKGEKVIDVCEAIEKMKQRAAKEAAREATKKATKKAQKAAQKEIQKAKELRFTTLFSNVKSLMEKMGLSLEQAMDVLSVSESDQKELRRLIN